MLLSNAKMSACFGRSEKQRNNYDLEKPINLLIEGDNYHALSVFELHAQRQN